MPRLFSQLLQTWAGRNRARRRQANLRAGDRLRERPQLALVAARVAAALPSSRAGWWWTMLAVLLALAGGALIVGHARHLAGATLAPAPARTALAVEALRSAMPGAAFTVPDHAGATTSLQANGALLVLAGMQPAPVVRVDLCSQLRNPGDPADARLLPLRLGERFDDVARQVAANRTARTPTSLRNVLLVSDSGTGPDAMPQVRIEGNARADFADPLSAPLLLAWRSRQGTARWISDASLGQVEQGAAGQVALRRHGWLLWGAASALRLERRANVLCPRAGELLVQLYRRAPAIANQTDNHAADIGDIGATTSSALVVAFPARGAAVRTRLAAGTYVVPAGPAPVLEDQALFDALQAAGLLRLTAGGVIALAPRDLPQWLAASPADRVARLDDWRHIVAGAATDKLFKRLYYQADGAYVRQQVDRFNGERRLLAWRMLAGSAPTLEWRATVAAGDGSSRGNNGRSDGNDGNSDGNSDGGSGNSDGSDGAGGGSGDGGNSGGSGPVMIATTASMPVAAARLFATLPQGWQPWTRVARWPAAGESAGIGLVGGLAPQLRLALALPQPAAGGEVLRLLVAGQVVGSSGAAMRTSAACSGRACTAADQVQQVTLTVQAGAREVAVTVRPLAFSAPDDEQYRHLRLVAGKLQWQALTGSAAVPVSAPSPVRLTDRHGTMLWDDGAPTEAASAAGLAPLLGIGPEHSSSVAGMLARLPATGASVSRSSALAAMATGVAAAGAPATGPLQGGAPTASASTDAAAGVGVASSSAAVSATLTLDLPLQALSQRILDCVGMRQGRWTGAGTGAGAGADCAGGHTVPAGRRAGMVILDTENGDLLAAAGAVAGAGEISAANWSEVRDHDRTNPARSPLRLPALQHDGGAHQSPGSTFKVISAMGLERAAQKDPQLDALLGGLPLPAINAFARQRGFDFQTGAATYPQQPQLARITNYREQSLDQRARDGRLGLAQALTYSLNTWFAWTGELSDRSLFGRPDGGAPGVQPLDADALDAVRPIVAAAHRLGFEQPVKLDGGLLPADFDWRTWDALQATPAHIDPVHTRHELRQMAIGLRMQVTPLHMALASAAVGQGRLVVPRLLLSLDGRHATLPAMAPTGVRLDRIRAGMKGVIDAGTGAGAFAGPALASVRLGLYGKTGTAPTGDDTATVWFTGWLEPGTLPGQTHRLAFAAFVSHSDSTGGGHAAPVVAAVLSTLVAQNREQKGK